MTKTWLELVAVAAALGMTVAGCASSPGGSEPRRPWQIPSAAQIVAQGPAPISFLLTRPGMVYIYDDTAGTLLNTTDLTRPDTSITAGLLLVDKSQSAVVVREPGEEDSEEEVVLVPAIDPMHRFSIWFAPASGDGSEVADQATTVPHESTN